MKVQTQKIVELGFGPKSDHSLNRHPPCNKSFTVVVHLMVSAIRIIARQIV